MDRAELRNLAHAILRDEVGAAFVGRLCPLCGNGDHGNPYILTPGKTAPRVSISYATGLVAVAWSDGPIGIDVEDDGPPVDGQERRAFGEAEALFKAGAVVPTQPIEVPAGYVGTVAGHEVNWRLAGPAAPPG